LVCSFNAKDSVFVKGNPKESAKMRLKNAVSSCFTFLR
jgi:hypothetical protein